MNTDESKEDPAQAGDDSEQLSSWLEEVKSEDHPPPDHEDWPAESPPKGGSSPHPSGLAAAREEADPELAPEGGALSQILRVLGQVRAGWRAERCGQAAAALAFHSAVLLGVLAWIGVAVLKATGQLDPQSRLMRGMAARLLPVTADARLEVAQQLGALTAGLSPGAVIIGGGLLGIVLGFLLFLQVESLWSSAWSAPARRPLFHRFLLFNAALTLLPLPLLFICIESVEQFLGGPGTPLHLLASFLTATAALTVAGRVLPATQVHWRSALLGGFASALLLEAGKLVCGMYLVRLLSGLPELYGLLMLVPVALFWLYLGWLAILFGVELAHAAQDYRKMELRSRAQALQEHDLRGTLLTEEPVFRLLGDIASHFAGGGKASPTEMLCQRSRLPERVVRDILRQLEERDVVLAVNDGYLPARPLERIRLHEVITVFRAPASAEGRASALDKLLHDLDESSRKRLADLTLSDLI